MTGTRKVERASHNDGTVELERATAKESTP